MPTWYSCFSSAMFARSYFVPGRQPFHGVRGVLGDRADGPDLVDRARTNQVKHAVVADDLLSCRHGGEVRRLRDWDSADCGDVRSHFSLTR